VRGRVFGLPLIFLTIVMHEVSHLVAIYITGAQFRVVGFDQFLTSFTIEVRGLDPVRQVFVAMAPRTVDAAFLITFLMTGDLFYIVLAGMNIFMSSIDFSECIRIAKRVIK